MKFVFQMIEDIQDLAQFADKEFSIENNFFEIRDLIKEVQGLFTQQCEFKQIDLISNVDTAMP